MDVYTFLLWALGLVVIGIPLVLFGIPCIIAAIAIWRACK